MVKASKSINATVPVADATPMQEPQAEKPKTYIKLDDLVEALSKPEETEELPPLRVKCAKSKNGLPFLRGRVNDICLDVFQADTGDELPVFDGCKVVKATIRKHSGIECTEHNGLKFCSVFALSVQIMED